MRPVPLVALLLATAALIALPAAAKEGVRAKLDKPVRLDTAHGKTIRVLWRLIDDEGRPFGAGGIYLRVSRCAGKPLRIRAATRGRGKFSARVIVPEGGFRKLMVGLTGWRIIGDRRERADRFFQFDPPLYRRCG
jgi:hypothetical protein